MKALSKTSWSEKGLSYVPGSHGMHELLHTLSIILNILETEVYDHPALKFRKTWEKQADLISSNLIDLYQKVQKEHLKK